MGKKRKQAMSSAEAQIGNVVGIDPHKRSLSAAVLDHRGGLLGCRHFPVSAKGHQALETWVLSLGPVLRWGIEGASGLGRHTCRRAKVGVVFRRRVRRRGASLRGPAERPPSRRPADGSGRGSPDRWIDGVGLGCSRSRTRSTPLGHAARSAAGCGPSTRDVGSAQPSPRWRFARGA
jgi:hypothetical protein